MTTLRNVPHSVWVRASTPMSPRARLAKLLVVRSRAPPALLKPLAK
jgi:hypothetical protein